MYPNDKFTHKSARKAHKVRKLNKVNKVDVIGVTLNINVGLGMRKVNELSDEDWKIHQVVSNPGGDIVIELYPR